MATAQQAIPADPPTAPGARPRRWQGRGADAAVVVLATITVFPVLARRPLAGLDAGYPAALNLAQQQGLGFGPDLLFTYGPWGFLAFPFAYVPSHWLLAAAVAVASRLVLVALTYALLRRAVPRWVAFLVLVVGLPPLLPQHIVLTLIAMVAALLGVLEGRRASWPWWAAGGAYVAFVTMVKFDSAVVSAALLATAAVASVWWCEQGRLRQAATRLLALAASGVLAFTVCWVAAGQPLGDAVPWLRGSVAMARGYASAMGVEEPGRWYEYLFAVGLALAAIAATAWAPRTERRLRVALGAVCGVALYLAFRQGFTRHDIHVVAFFLPVVFLAGGLCSVWGWRRALPIGLVGLVLCSVVSGVALADRVRIDKRVANAVRAAEVAVSSQARADLIDAGREELRTRYGLPEALVATLSGSTVHVSPHEASIAWAHPELVWDPLPVFQEYAAYEASLDELNARRLASEEAPRYVLRRPEAIDGKLARWESPAASLALACRYEVVQRVDGWLLAARAADTCGAPRPAGAGTVAVGEPLPLPEVGPGQVLVGRFTGVGQGPLDRLGTLLFKAPTYEVAGDDGRAHRFVPGTQGQWHVLRAPPCFREVLDGPVPWEATSLTFRAPELPLGSPEVGYELATIPITCR